jgi:Formamidopyrimidine-DNA glycosylase
MLELPEVLTIAEQLEKTIVGKKISKVLPPSKVHKFCWYNGDPMEYDAAIKNCEVISVAGFGIYVEIEFSNGYKLCFNDGVNARIMDSSQTLKGYQLLIEFGDESVLVFTVAMYGGIIFHNGNYDNEYYLKSRNALDIFSAEFKNYYEKTLNEAKQNLSAKAFLATEQRFPGIGNGVLQDILFTAYIHPKRKISTFGKEEKDRLLNSIIEVLENMIKNHGRNTEKDIFGDNGGYKVLFSKNTVGDGCPRCGNQIVKEAYLGGAVYYCPLCQPLIK